MSKEMMAAYWTTVEASIDSRAPRVIKAELLPQKTLVYYFVKETKQGKCKNGFVDEARDHIFRVTTTPQRRGHKLRIAYEDIRLVPSSALFYDLERIEREWGTDSANTSNVDPMAIDVGSGSEASSFKSD